ncbi:MAG TPA: hypothetical protein VIJ26_17335, partial [Thermoanaerobaculia bacterium]
MDIVGTITAPARLGFRIAIWGARTAVGLLPGGHGDEPAAAGPTAEEQPAPAETVARPAPAPPPEPEPPQPEPAEPAHVDEGATVVA